MSKFRFEPKGAAPVEIDGESRELQSIGFFDMECTFPDIPSYEAVRDALHKGSPGRLVHPTRGDVLAELCGALVSADFENKQSPARATLSFRLLGL